MFILRALQIGLSIDDLDALSYGQVVDILVESANDYEEYDYLPTQEDYDSF